MNLYKVRTIKPEKPNETWHLLNLKEKKLDFKTTVNSENVNQQRLPSGDLHVSFKEQRYQGALGYFLGIAWVIAVLTSVVWFFFGLDKGGFSYVVVSIALLAGCVYVFPVKRLKTSSFTIVPNQGIKLRGEQIAFDDIDTLVTTYAQQNGQPTSLTLNVLGKQISLVGAARPSEITYIKQILKDNSPVSFS